MIAFDPNPASHAGAIAHGIEIGSMEEVMRAADVVVATTGRAGLILPSMVRRGQVILALTNPDPEIEPELAEAAGAAFAADGRSVNNVVGYPGIFRGALLAGASGHQRRDEAGGRPRRSPTSRPKANWCPTCSTRRSTTRWRPPCARRPSAAGWPARTAPPSCERAARITAGRGSPRVLS